MAEEDVDEGFGREADEQDHVHGRARVGARDADFIHLPVGDAAQAEDDGPEEQHERDQNGKADDRGAREGEASEPPSRRAGFCAALRGRVLVDILSALKDGDSLLSPYAF